MINLKQLEDVHSRVEDAIREGARVRTGGRRSPKFEKGFFYEPTVMVDVKHNMNLVRTETFGPIMPIMRVRGIEEAIALANDSSYGLGANIYTNNMEWAMTARSRGIKVVIAAAGGAAHLPGVVAAWTDLPVIGVPVPTQHLGGVDSLYSIVQMPAGVPVATVAIGEAGAKNAAWLAARIIGLQDADVEQRHGDKRAALATS